MVGGATADSRRVWWGFFTIALGTAFPAFGQVDTIIVTARKRDERLLDIPQTLTVLTDAQIAARGVLTSADIAPRVANLTWHSVLGLATPQIFLRGIGNATFNANQANPVGVHVDGLYQGSNVTYGFPVFDLQRIEVLKGPQGTLFGRNTTGGVINFVTRAPDQNEGLNGFGRASYGRFDETNLEAAVGAPVGAGSALRIAGVMLRRDGYAVNRNPAAAGTPAAGRIRLWAARAQAAVTSGPLDILLNVHGGENHSDIPAGKQIGVLCPPGVSNGRIGQCTDFFGFRDTTNVREHFRNVRSRDRVDTWGGMATAKLAFDGFNLVSQTGFEGNRRRLTNDSDAGPFAAVKTDVAGRFRQFSQEFRAVSTPGAKLAWLIGANYYQDRLQADQAFTVNAFGPGGLSRVFPVEEGIASGLIQRTRSFAAFAEAEYRIDSRWSLTGGVRWTSDRRTAETDAFLFNATGLAQAFVSAATARSRVLAPTIPSRRLARTWEEWSGRGSLAYRLTNDALAYVQVSHGFKGGDFNGGALFAPAEATIADPEFVTAYEVGAKGAALEGRLTYAAAAFRYDFTDQQVAVLVPGSNATLQSLANAAKTRVNGVELEIGARPIPSLLFEGHLGLLDAEFVRFQLDASNPATNFAGRRTASSPKATAGALLRYEIPMGENVLGAQVETSYTGKHFFTVDNNPSLSQSGYWLLNARLAFERDDASVAIWVRNLADRTYFVSGLGNAGLGFLELIPGPPRTYGVTLSARF